MKKGSNVIRADLFIIIDKRKKFSIREWERERERGRGRENLNYNYDYYYY